MTVHELREQLSKFPGNADVAVLYPQYDGDFVDVVSVHGCGFDPASQSQTLDTAKHCHVELKLDVDVEYEKQELR